ncbi:type II toxin-antitoxin system ParD family antitoxin [Moheibacter lacus]|uniref:Type II toxin-antitoxin system ParD family antitoxin n=1 Tax=Moheibacter lacus TaxID=2745851 RepID=A0A838ZRN4_9FLAO|nr:type II toxin-antitoxin system ParD family antitoxin [Moheibacter lacus]MBA5628349.1 type II toxin-antitoxin system ParD family antitoxin [Moheibacter lacus]
MNVSLTKKQEEYISEQVASGEYQNNSELVRDALRLHKIYREKVIQDLRKEIELGWEGENASVTMDQIIASKRNG